MPKVLPNEMREKGAILEYGRVLGLREIWPTPILNLLGLWVTSLWQKLQKWKGSYEGRMELCAKAFLH
jgi:hypothetical protein